MRGGGEPALISVPEGKSIAFDERGGEKSLALKHYVSTLKVSVSADASSWLSARVTPNAVAAVAQPNSAEGLRSATLTLGGAGLTETISVTQTGSAPFMQPSAKEYTMNEYGGELVIKVVTNREFEPELPSDAEWIKLKETSGENPVLVTFKVDGLTKGSRTA